MAGTQSYPIEYPGHADSRMTCSPPIKGQNAGCQFFRVCREKTKGTYPVNVFAVDRHGRAVVINHCAEWYRRLKDMMEPDGLPRFTRIARPETFRVKVAAQRAEVGQGRKTEVVEVPSPPLELRGEAGSGCYTGDNPGGHDMLGEEVRKMLGEGGTVDVDDLLLGVEGIEDFGASGGLTGGAPITVNAPANPGGARPA